MSVEKSLLGKDTLYPTTYQPEILFPISRSLSRESYANVTGIQQGCDWWHVFELSWLNAQDIPQVAIGRLRLPATSPNLIESKSLKLYFNSLNFMRFSSKEQLITTVQQDLSKAAEAPVQLTLIDVNHLAVSQPEGQCLDQLVPERLSGQPDASLLEHTGSGLMIEEQYYSNLLRSNCPVTGQPDWGTIFIRYRGEEICPESLLAYILSYRQHNGFHEQCVEQIYADIWKTLKPGQLMVYAAYTRRGGLDINPCRVSTEAWLPQTPVRLARQ
ncbi:NADPH-dependent 7-cyano-7-deazaguanine reductase QueF [Acinetobacter sp. ANC 4640]